METAAVSTKGQVVIPHEFRKRYGLKPNSRATWVDMGHVLMLVPKAKDAVGQSRGLLKKSGFTQDELKKSRRNEKA